MQTLCQESPARVISRRRSLSELCDEAPGTSGLFSNLDILPVQFHCSLHCLYHEMGEIALMYAVLQDAIDLGTKEETQLMEPLRAYVNARIGHLTAMFDLNVAMGDLTRASGWEGAAPEVKNAPRVGLSPAAVR